MLHRIQQSSTHLNQHQPLSLLLSSLLPSLLDPNPVQSVPLQVQLRDLSDLVSLPLSAPIRLAALPLPCHLRVPTNPQVLKVLHQGALL